jgi:hypothetical protein
LRCHEASGCDICARGFDDEEVGALLDVGDGGGDRLMSTSLGSMVAGSMAAGLWEEEEEDASGEERMGGGKAGDRRLGPAVLFRETWLFRFLIRERSGLPSTLFCKMFTHSSASSGLAAISTKRS